MRKTLLATALGIAAALPPLANAEDVTSVAPALTGNLNLVTDYVYRGISQTRGAPALQGGFDYASPGGLYVGVWGSNISWIQDTLAATGSSLEFDIYGGYRGSLSGDFGFDVGLQTYNYPLRNLAAGFLKPDTQEVYVALTYQWLTLKYSRSLGALFGWAKADGSKTSGSGYLELNASIDLGDGWGLTGHAGHQTVKDLPAASYSDYRFGISRDIGFGVLGLAVTSTTAKDNCGAAEAYCWGGYRAGKSAAIVSFAKPF